MYKYENIKKVLNFVPKGLLEEENESDIIKNALIFYQQNVRLIDTDDILFSVSQIDNHVVELPLGFKKVLDIGYNQVLPDNDNPNSLFFTFQELPSNKTIIFQRIAYSWYQPFFTCMKYAGKDSTLVDNPCTTYLCDDCIGYSINTSLKNLTLDQEEGYVFLLYTSTMKDDDGNFMVIDHNLLWQAMSYYCEYCHFRDASFRREGGADERGINKLQMANNLLKEFLKVHLFTHFDPVEYQNKVLYPRQIPQLSNQRDYTNYKK